MNQFYLHLAITRYWNDHPEDREIPFIGLSQKAQDKVKSIATMLMLEDEHRNLQRITNYKPVMA